MLYMKHTNKNYYMYIYRVIQLLCINICITIITMHKYASNLTILFTKINLTLNSSLVTQIDDVDNNWAYSFVS